MYSKTQDVDIVVSEQSLDQEDIKETIADADSRYYLVPSKRGSFQKLYCRLPGWATDSTRCVKVDILVPPTLNLPTINGSETYRISDIPVMPIFDLLVMKTQGWWDDRNSNRPDLRAKERDNVSDIFALLDCATQGNVSYANEAKKYRHSREFMNHARTLVNKFVSAYDRPRQWRALGFPV